LPTFHYKSENNPHVLDRRISGAAPIVRFSPSDPSSVDPVSACFAIMISTGLMTLLPGSVAGLAEALKVFP
jgi:hypothetical protein